MSNGKIVFSRPFELSWHIRVHDLALEMGKIRFENVVDESSFVGDESDDADRYVIKVVEASPSWKEFVLPIFINELVLADPSGEPLQNVPVYEEAAFVIDNFSVEMLWALKGCGFGNFYLRTIGGTPHIDNECMSKASIKRVFDLIQLP